jgi:hypothetical protein
MQNVRETMPAFEIYMFMRLVCSQVTPWIKAFLEQLIRHHLAKNILAFYGIRSFITAFTSVRLLTLSEPYQFTPHLPVPIV